MSAVGFFVGGQVLANILRALTDKRLLQASIARLGGGTGLGALSEHTVKALLLGLLLGFIIEVARKLLERNARYQGFVNLPAALWFGAGT